MKKWMFSHRWGLHGAVLSGEKTTTIRIIPDKIVKACINPDSPFDYPDHEKLVAASPVQVGDLVAVAEPYRDVFPPLNWEKRVIYSQTPGWTNKMFVDALEMRYFLEVLKVGAFEFTGLPQDQLDKEGFQAFLRSLKPEAAKNAKYIGRGQRLFFKKTMGWDYWSERHFVWRYTFRLCKRGTCRVCGCTWDHPCMNPEHGLCWWHDETETICSHCALPKISQDPRTVHAVECHCLTDPLTLT